jgi:hypothetical protein
MKTYIEAGGFKFEVWQIGTGEEAESKFVEGGYCFKHRVAVRRNGVKTRFTFWGSVHDYEQGKDELDEDDLKHALTCFLEDAYAGMHDFEEFCSNYGYGDNREAYKIWLQCRRTLKQVERLGIHNEDDLIEILNDLRE